MQICCPTVHDHVKRGGRANKKIFHVTDTPLTDQSGLPAYTIARDELAKSFRICFGLMAGYKQEAFRDGLDHEWDVTSAIGL